VNTVRTVTFLLANPNPIDIKIEKFYFTLPNAKIQLDYMKLLDGNQTKILSRNKDISQVRLEMKTRNHLFISSLLFLNNIKRFSH
jgi:hypothetical protein